MVKFRGLRDELYSLSLELNEMRTEPSRRCSSHIDPATTLLAVYSSAWPDISLTDAVIQGVAPMGPQVSLGILPI